MKEIEGTAERFTVTYDGLINDVFAGSKILLDDGLIELEVQDIDHENQEIKTKALNSGTIKNKKGVNVPNVKRSEEHTSELQSRGHLVCRLLLEKKKKHIIYNSI